MRTKIGELEEQRKYHQHHMKESNSRRGEDTFKERTKFAWHLFSIAAKVITQTNSIKRSHFKNSIFSLENENFS